MIFGISVRRISASIGTASGSDWILPASAGESNHSNTLDRVGPFRPPSLLRTERIGFHTVGSCI